MTRSLRYGAAGAVYHVMARGDGGKPVFEDDKDRYGWVDLLEREMGSVCGKWGQCANLDKFPSPQPSQHVAQKPEARSQKPEARSQKPEARSQKPEARSQKPEARSQKPISPRPPLRPPQLRVSISPLQRPASPEPLGLEYDWMTTGSPDSYLTNVVDHFAGEGSHLRIFNHSISDVKPCQGKRMCAWAAKIDDLVHRHHLLFVQVSGNFETSEIFDVL